MYQWQVDKYFREYLCPLQKNYDTVVKVVSLKGVIELDKERQECSAGP